MLVTSSVKRDLSAPIAPRAIEENAETVLTSVRYCGSGEPNNMSPNHLSDQRYYFLWGYRTHYEMQVKEHFLTMHNFSWGIFKQIGGR